MAARGRSPRRQIETDASGAVTVLEATFTQNCEGPNSPALTVREALDA